MKKSHTDTWDPGAYREQSTNTSNFKESQCDDKITEHVLGTSTYGGWFCKNTASESDTSWNLSLLALLVHNFNLEASEMSFD